VVILILFYLLAYTKDVNKILEDLQNRIVIV
jgi:hypothetical protein